MRYLESILYIDYAEMVVAGVSDQTLKIAKHRQSSSWTFMDDPEDRRKVLIEFDSLKDKYKQAITDKYGCPHTYIRQSALKSLLQKDAKALSFYQKRELPTGKGLPKEAIAAYTKAADWLNMLIRFNESEPKKTLKALGMASRRDFYDACIAIIKAERIDLPKSYSRLMETIRDYNTKGTPNYGVIISGKYGNANSQKISKEAGEWLCAYYGCPFPKATIEKTWMDYNAIAPSMGWVQLEHHSTVYQYLYHEKNEQRWYGMREGHLKEKERFGLQAKTLRASMRDALWFADGTGLNFIASDSKMQRVYWVMDDHSEVILGWDIDVSENEKSVYRAFKAAVNFAGHKPYEIRYDQSSANIKIGPFIENIAGKLHFACEAYNGKSKSIESATGRFQQQIMNQWFFFSGQNRGSRADRSVANMEAILEVKKMLPEFKQACLVFGDCVNDWHNAPHPKIAGKTRMEVYLESVNPFATPFSAVDAVEAFWNTAPKPITYVAAGLPITVGGTKYLFEVYDNDTVDIAFRRKHIGAKFIVRYDPEDMSQAWLYEETHNGLAFVAAADNVDAHRFHIATQDHTEGEKGRITEFLALRRKDNAERKQQGRELAEKHGKLPVQIATKQMEKVRVLSMADHYREDDNYQHITLYGGNNKIQEGQILDENED